MTPGPGIEPRIHWWEASALTTAPSLLPESYSMATLWNFAVGLMPKRQVKFLGKIVDETQIIKALLKETKCLGMSENDLCAST